jgi:hypothetical protein
MGANIEKGELFDKYKKWAENTKNFTLSQARFASCVFKHFHKVTPKNTKDLTTKKRIWRNLQYSEFQSSQQPNAGWESE